MCRRVKIFARCGCVIAAPGGPCNPGTRPNDCLHMKDSARMYRARSCLYHKWLKREWKRIERKLTAHGMTNVTRNEALALHMRTFDQDGSEPPETDAISTDRVTGEATPTDSSTAMDSDESAVVRDEFETEGEGTAPVVLGGLVDGVAQPFQVANRHPMRLQSSAYRQHLVDTGRSPLIDTPVPPHSPPPPNDPHFRFLSLLLGGLPPVESRDWVFRSRWEVPETPATPKMGERDTSSPQYQAALAAHCCEKLKDYEQPETENSD